MDEDKCQNSSPPSTRKKIIFCGPPKAGKTTLKEIFFEKANPLRLLTTALEPTKGFERSLYSQLHNEIAVFDLGGQENDRWFGKDQEIFQCADLIIYVCPVTVPLDAVTTLLLLLSRTIYNQCPNAKLLFLYHKRDLLPVVGLAQRIKQLRQFLKVKSPELLNQMTMYITSIAEPFFFATYRIFGEIFRKIIKLEGLLITPLTFRQAELALQILLEVQTDVKYHISLILSRYHLLPDEALLVLDRLNSMNFVEFFCVPNAKILDSFQLTVQAKFFITSIKRNLVYSNKLANNIRSTQKIIEIFSRFKKTNM